LFQLQLEEEETLRKRAANKTALDAIGPRKKRKLDDALSTEVIHQKIAGFSIEIQGILCTVFRSDDVGR
jgi:hypothetical protein